MAFRALPAAARDRDRRCAQRFAGVHDALENKYWVDEFYGATVVRPDRPRLRSRCGSSGTRPSWTARSTASATCSRAPPAILRLFQTGFVGTYALFLVLGVLALLLHFLRSLTWHTCPGCRSLVFFPLVGARRWSRCCRRGARHASARCGHGDRGAAEFALSLPLWWRLVPGAARLAVRGAPRLDPAPSARSYHLGVDGISVLLALLTTLHRR